MLHFVTTGTFFHAIEIKHMVLVLICVHIEISEIAKAVWVVNSLHICSSKLG
jgi:hypothetical protein